MYLPSQQKDGDPVPGFDALVPATEERRQSWIATRACTAAKTDPNTPGVKAGGIG